MLDQVQTGWAPGGRKAGQDEKPGGTRRAEPHPAATEPQDLCVETLAPALRAQGLSFKAIALQLGLYTAQARDLCRPPDPKARGASARPARRRGRKPATGLSRRALRVLLDGSHAFVGGGSVGERMRHLPRIAAAYRRAELLAEPGVGRATAAEIELWLASLGFHFLGAEWPRRR